MATREDILRKLDISSDDWVLEIGGGQNPFIRSDVLADKFLSDNTERAGSLIVDRPIVICDAHYLPFVDASFDYVFCSQILEHLEKPEQFFKEIARIGKRGYIETPNEIRERLFGWPFHKWLVDKDENGLVLRKNDVDQVFGLFFHKLQLINYEFAKFCSSSFDLLNICYEWHGEPRFRFVNPDECKLPVYKECISTEDIPTFVMSEPYEMRLSDNITALKRIKKRIPKGLKRYIKRFIHPLPFGVKHSEEETKSYLKKILACPICKLKVSFKKGRINCFKCKKQFKIENNIPFMIVE